MHLSLLLLAFLVATTLAAPNPIPKPNSELRARFYDELQKRHCPGGNNDNICGEGYLYCDGQCQTCGIQCN
ncbi:hypothetical protein ACLMJK_009529 [Lecanora helva]